MITLFDYIYYRVYLFFQSKGDKVPETKGHLVLSLMQFFILLDIVVSIRLFYPFQLPPKILVLPMIFFIGGVNWYKYEQNVEFGKLNDKWKDEDLKIKERRGLLIVFCFLFSFLIPVIAGYIDHNL